MMPYIEVLLEGASDKAVLHELLARHFKLEEAVNFRLHPHKGKGKLPENPLAKPEIHHRGLLDQLPAKLRGFGKSLPATALVLVVIDVDNDTQADLLRDLSEMLAQLPSRPARVMFKLAIEETESWFLADLSAVKSAYPKASIQPLKAIAPDAIVGAWEKLAVSLGCDIKTVTGSDKYEWAQAIAPHMHFSATGSPSLKDLIAGVDSYVMEFTS